LDSFWKDGWPNDRMRHFFSSSVCGRANLQWRRVAKLASLGLKDWYVLAEALMTLVVVEVALRLGNFRWILSWATSASGVHPGESSSEEIERTIWLLSVGGRLTRLRCLTKSLALMRLLSRRGVVTDLWIGVRPEDDKLEAHAWVQWKGRALNEDARRLQRFAAFDRAVGSS
jgi:hypothetical protein